MSVLSRAPRRGLDGSGRPTVALLRAASMAVAALLHWLVGQPFPALRDRWVRAPFGPAAGSPAAAPPSRQSPTPATSATP